MKKFFALLLCSIFLLYGIVWFYTANNAKSTQKARLWLINQKILADLKQNQAPQLEKSQVNVLGTRETVLPLSYELSIVPRKQVFNLSCEFAAAAAIIYQYNNDDFFAPQNELLAEKALIAKVPASLNPNIGIRMGKNATESADTLFQNLNEKFGGVEYYGIHAPPFIDVFAEYKLVAKPIRTITQIKNAIFSGHMVMAWIQLGYGKTSQQAMREVWQIKDIALSYGKTPVVEGEHAIVIYGYDQAGIFAMDPAKGENRHITYEMLEDASWKFVMPFLEIYPSVLLSSYSPTEKVDNITGLDRSVLRVVVENGSEEVGDGSRMAEILKEFGYHVVELKRVSESEDEGVRVLLKEKVSDYSSLIKKDLSLAGYDIASISASLQPELEQDVIVFIGE